MARTFVNLGVKLLFGARHVMCPRCTKWCRPLRGNPEAPAGHVRPGRRELCRRPLEATPIET